LLPQDFQNHKIEPVPGKLFGGTELKDFYISAGIGVMRKIIGVFQIDLPRLFGFQDSELKSFGRQAKDKKIRPRGEIGGQIPKTFGALKSAD